LTNPFLCVYILKNNQITLSPYFKFIFKTGLGLPKTNVCFYCAEYRERIAGTGRFFLDPSPHPSKRFLGSRLHQVRFVWNPRKRNPIRANTLLIITVSLMGMAAQHLSPSPRSAKSSRLAHSHGIWQHNPRSAVFNDFP